MASSTTIQLDSNSCPILAVRDLGKDSAEKATKLLQENHEKHHIFFNKSGYHNHIVHHLLSIYALGAPPDIIQRSYDENSSYQRSIGKIEDKFIRDLHKPEIFHRLLGDGKHYRDYLVYFQNEIETKGWKNVLNEYLFKGDDRANDLLARMHAGFLHPIIHLGFGVEFDQPAIIAEALAQAAVHEDWLNSYLFATENAAKENGNPFLTLVQIMAQMRADEKLRNAPQWEDANKIRDGIIARAGNEMIKYASQYMVNPAQLEKKTAEMINFTLYYTGAAQHPPNIPKIDFYFMHCANSSIFYSWYLSADWLSTASKIRLLEFKARLDLAMYVSRLAPQLLLDEIVNYKPKHPSEDFAPVFERIVRHVDDGHASKLIRAIANGEKVCKKWEGEDGFVLKGSMWLQLAHLVVDSVEVGTKRWIRSAGFEEAWKDVPLREGAKL